MKIVKFGLSALLIFYSHSFCSARAQEPLHKGRPIATWLAELVDDDKGKKIRAEDELRTMGTNALATMLRYITAPEDPFGGNAKSSVAYRSFQLLGAEAKPVIPQLITLLQSPDSRSDASYALIFIGEESVPSLISVLTNKDPQVREIALITMKHALTQSNKLSPKADLVLPAVTKCITDNNADVSINAMMTLSAICTNTDFVVKEIIPNLESENAKVRNFAVGILRFSGAHGKPAIPALKKALLDKDNDVRTNAAMALHAIDPEEAKKAGAKVPLYE